MAIVDPLVISINSVSTNLPRIVSNTGGVYRTADGKYQASFRFDPSPKDVNRASLVVQFKRIVADELVPSSNKELTSLLSISLQSPKTGSGAAAEVAFAVDFLSKLTANSGALLLQMVNGEV